MDTAPLTMYTYVWTIFGWSLVLVREFHVGADGEAQPKDTFCDLTPIGDPGRPGDIPCKIIAKTATGKGRKTLFVGTVATTRHPDFFRAIVASASEWLRQIAEGQDYNYDSPLSFTQPHYC